jgi:mRNA interferase YafQ
VLKIVPTSRFRKDLKRIKKRGQNLVKMEEMIEALRNEEPLAPKYRDHLLSGEFEGHRELHLAPDWLLVYIISGDRLNLVRTGMHSDIFG